MKNCIAIITVLFICSLALVSCTSRKPAEPVIIEKIKTVEKKQRDTILVSKPDSSFYKAFLECQNNKVVVKNFESNSGKNIQKPKVEIKNNYLQVKCKVDSAKIALKWWETNTTIQDPKIIYVPKVEYIEKPFKWYHKALMWLGGIFLVLIAFLVTLKFVKP